MRPSATLLFLPLQKFAKQRLTLLLRQVCSCETGRFQKGGKIAGALRGSLLWTNTPQHLLRHAPARPAGDGGSKIDVAPLRVAWRLTELVPVREQALDEPSDAPVAIVSLLPRGYREHRWHRDRIDWLTFGNERRILFVGQLAEHVVVGERLGKRDRYEMQARVRRGLGKQIDWLCNHADQGGKLPALELL